MKEPGLVEDLLIYFSSVGTELEWRVNQVALVLIGLSLPIYFTLTFINAPYGRYHTQSLGFVALTTPIPATLGWVLMEIPNVLAVLLGALFFFPKDFAALPLCNSILLGLYFSHYVYRACVYPFLQTSKPQTLFAWLAAVVFCSCNGFIQVSSLMNIYKYDDEKLRSPLFIAGVSFWAVGIFTNVYSDHILRNLRKRGETGYKIPRGFLFEYVSCANYFGEVIEWMGYALACSNLAAFSFFCFTACNLIPRAVKHHQYYLSKMDDYPKSRKAVIPFML